MKAKVLKVYGASRYEQSALEAPANVTVITANDIRRYGYRTLSDALRGTAGLYVTDDRNYQYLGYRGFSLPGDYNTRVLVMIDGIRLNDPVYHQAPIGTDFPLDLSLIERIEVIRGPSQAIYGNNAFMLVLNVISKAPSSIGPAEADLYTDSRGLTRGTISTGQSINRLESDLLLSGTIFKTPGSDLYFSAYDDPATNNGMTNDTDYASGGSAFFKLIHEKSTLTGAYNRSRKGSPTAAWGATFNDTSTHTIDERFVVDLSYHALDRQTVDLKLRSYLYAYNYDGEYAYIPDPLYVDSGQSLTIGVEAVGNVRISDRNILVAGIDGRFDALVEQESSDGFHDRRQLDNFGLFIQNEYRPLDLLHLVAGLRYDYFSTDMQALNPKAAVILLPREDLAIKYLFGRSFRAPNAYELYNAQDGYRANPGLTEETLTSHELIADFQLDNHLRFTLTGFQYEYNDIITQYVTSDGLFGFANDEYFRTRGIESELSMPWGEWSGAIGHTYQHTLCTCVPENDIVTNSPTNLLKLRLSRELMGPKLLLSGELLYTSRLLTLEPTISERESTLVNLTLLRRDLLLKDLDASLSIYNLFDRSYAQPGANEHLPVALIPQDGITVGLKLSYRY
jgi:iron complex outermembrane receptor protein